MKKLLLIAVAASLALCDGLSGARFGADLGAGENGADLGAGAVNLGDKNAKGANLDAKNAANLDDKGAGMASLGAKNAANFELKGATLVADAARNGANFENNPADFGTQNDANFGAQNAVNSDMQNGVNLSAQSGVNSGAQNSANSSVQNTAIALTPEQAQNMMQNGADLHIVDVRASDLHNAQKFDGAVNLPIAALSEAQLDSALKALPSKTILMHCRSGRSVVAVAKRASELRPDLQIYYIAGRPIF